MVGNPEVGNPDFDHRYNDDEAYCDHSDNIIWEYDDDHY